MSTPRTDSGDAGRHRVVYTEVNDTYTRRHGTAAFDTKAEAEQARETIEGLSGYEGARVEPCRAGDGWFSDAAQPREGVLPRIELHPFVSEDPPENARFIEAHPDQTLTWGAVWVHVIVEFIDPYEKQPEEGPPVTMRVLAGYATPEQVTAEGFEETLHTSGAEGLRKSARRLRRHTAEQKGDMPESQRLLHEAATALKKAHFLYVGPAFHSRVNELDREAARYRRERGAEPIPAFPPEEASEDDAGSSTLSF